MKVIRLLLAFVAVFGTYNAFEMDYITLIQEKGVTPVVGIMGMLLIITWVIVIRATYNSLGPIGIGLVAAFLATLVWLMTDYIDVGPFIKTILQFCLFFLLAIGINWSRIRRKLSGQLDVNDVGD